MSREPVIHLVLCPNPDHFHGKRGKGEVFISYLIVPEFYLLVTVAPDGETVEETGLIRAKDRTVILEDVDEMVLLKVLNDNPQATIAEPDIWRICAHCRAKGVRGWDLEWREPADLSDWIDNTLQGS